MYDNKLNSLLVAVIGLAVLSGCGKDETNCPPADSAAVTNEVEYAALANDAVIVTVNGKPLTKGDVERDIDIKTTLIGLANPNMSVSAVKRQADKVRSQAIRQYVSRCAILDEAARRGIVLDDSDRQAIRKQFAKGLGKAAKLGYAGVRKRLSPDQAQALDVDLDADKLFGKTRAALRADCTAKVSSNEAAQVRTRLLAYNDRAKKAEEAIYQQATNVWKRINAGESFENAVVRSEGEHVATDLDWGLFALSYFKDDAELQRLLRVMPDNTVTPPVAADNGLIIVKKIGEELADGANPLDNRRLHLAKIFFELPEYAEVGTVDDVRGRLERERTDAALKLRIDEIVAAAVVTYPSGCVKFPQTKRANLMSGLQKHETK